MVSWLDPIKKFHGIRYLVRTDMGGVFFRPSSWNQQHSALPMLFWIYKPKDNVTLSLPLYSWVFAVYITGITYFQDLELFFRLPYITGNLVFLTGYSTDYPSAFYLNIVNANLRKLFRNQCFPDNPHHAWSKESVINPAFPTWQERNVRGW